MIMREYVQPRFFDVMLRSQFSPPTLAHVSRRLRATYLRLAGIASPPATKSELFVDQDRYREFVPTLRKIYAYLVSALTLLKGIKHNVRWLAKDDVILMSALRCNNGGLAPPVFNIFQSASRIRAVVLHVDRNVMLAFHNRQIRWKYGLEGLPNLENIILAFTIPDRGPESVPGTDTLTWQIDTMTLPGLPELAGSVYNIRYKGILCGRPGISCLGTITLNDQDITDDIHTFGSLHSMRSSIQSWWTSREAFITAQEREPKAPTIDICAIWPEDLPEKVKARYASVYSRQGSVF